MPFCIKCGAKMPDEAAFCNNCGAPMLNKQQEQAQTQPVAPQQVNPIPQQVPVQQANPVQPVQPQPVPIAQPFNQAYQQAPTQSVNPQPVNQGPKLDNGVTPVCYVSNQEVLQNALSYDKSRQNATVSMGCTFGKDDNSPITKDTYKVDIRNGFFLCIKDNLLQVRFGKNFYVGLVDLTADLIKKRVDKDFPILIAEANQIKNMSFEGKATFSKCITFKIEFIDGKILRGVVPAGPHVNEKPAQFLAWWNANK